MACGTVCRKYAHGPGCSEVQPGEWGAAGFTGVPQCLHLPMCTGRGHLPWLKVLQSQKKFWDLAF